MSRVNVRVRVATPENSASPRYNYDDDAIQSESRTVDRFSQSGPRRRNLGKSESRFSVGGYNPSATRLGRQASVATRFGGTSMRTMQTMLRPDAAPGLSPMLVASGLSLSRKSIATSLAISQDAKSQMELSEEIKAKATINKDKLESMTPEEGWKFLKQRILTGLWRVDFARFLSKGDMDEKLMEEMGSDKTQAVEYHRFKWLTPLLFWLFFLIFCLGGFAVFIGAEFLGQSKHVLLGEIVQYRPLHYRPKKFDKTKDADAMTYFSTASAVVGEMKAVVACGVLVVLASFIGVVAAKTRNTNCFRFLVFFIPIVVLGVVVAGAIAAALVARVSAASKEMDWRRLVGLHGVEATATEFLDWTQTQFECCGYRRKDDSGRFVSAWKAWSGNPYYNCSAAAAADANCRVPPSCCHFKRRLHFGFACVRTEIQRSDASSASKEIWTRGCDEALESFFSDFLLVVVVTLSVTAFAKSVCLFGLYIVNKQVATERRRLAIEADREKLKRKMMRKIFGNILGGNEAAAPAPVLKYAERS